MLSQLSAKHVGQLLGCLRNSYKLACEFDLRPGLKFLVQKVAHTPVAVNLYKQAGASMVFYIHTLIKICSNLPDLDRATVCNLLSKKDSTEEKSSNDSEKESNGTLNDGRKEEQNGVESNNQQQTSVVEPLEADSPERSANVNSQINQCKEGLPSSGADSVSSRNARWPDGKEHLVKPRSQIDGVDTQFGSMSLDPSRPKITDNGLMYVQQLKAVCEELCQTYTDILYDKAGTSCVDSMADQQLFFLIAQPDEFPEISPARVDVKQLNKKLEQTQARLQGQTVTTQAVSVQGQCHGTVEQSRIRRLTVWTITYYTGVVMDK